MYRVVDKRSSGKTCRLILLAKECNGIVASHCPKYIIEKANCFGIQGIKVCSYQELLNKDYDTTLPVFIDDLELFAKFSVAKLGGYSISTNDTDYADVENELSMNKVKLDL